MLPGDEVDGLEYLVTELSATLAALTTGFGGANVGPWVITWEELQHECKEDSVMVTLVDQIRRGFPD